MENNAVAALWLARPDHGVALGGHLPMETDSLRKQIHVQPPVDGIGTGTHGHTDSIHIFPSLTLSVSLFLFLSPRLSVLASLLVRLLGGSLLPPGTLSTMSWLACAE